MINPRESISRRRAAVCAAYAACAGASLVGFMLPASAAAGRTGQDKGHERISVSDYANQVFTATAKSPGDPNSHVATSFSSWRLAIQAALDEAYNRGGGTVVIDGGSAPFSHPTLLIDDYLRIRDNTTVVFEAEVVLGDYTKLGSVIDMNGDNIVVNNPRINASGLFAGASGHNGLSGGTCSNVKVNGGTIRNCARGNAGGAFGGKGFQFEGTFHNVEVSGTTLDTCFMALSTNHDFSSTKPSGPLVFKDITAKSCAILLFVAQTNGHDTTGQAHSVALTGFRAKDCGTFEGLMQFSRASNVQVSDGIVSNATVIDSLVRGNHSSCRFENIRFTGDCSTALINLDPSTYARDASYRMENNSYSIEQDGTTPYIAYASPTTPNRTLADSRIRARLTNDVAKKIVGDELRNAYCVVEAQQGDTCIEVKTADLYLRGLARFASFRGKDEGSCRRRRPA
ncbi:MAG TPA: hypothetical protein VF453_10180 [Burkholderiaceae bacterium]